MGSKCFNPSKLQWSRSPFYCCFGGCCSCLVKHLWLQQGSRKPFKYAWWLTASHIALVFPCLASHSAQPHACRVLICLSFWRMVLQWSSTSSWLPASLGLPQVASVVPSPPTFPHVAHGIAKDVSAEEHARNCSCVLTCLARVRDGQRRQGRERGPGQTQVPIQLLLINVST